jgi:hypothetical protein
VWLKLLPESVRPQLEFGGGKVRQFALAAIEHWLFDQFIMGCILVNCLFLALADPAADEEPEYQEVVSSNDEGSMVVLFLCGPVRSGPHSTFVLNLIAAARYLLLFLSRLGSSFSTSSPSSASSNALRECTCATFRLSSL